MELRQYVNDAELYQGYVASKREGIDILCLNTFIKYKHELGVKRVKSLGSIRTQLQRRQLLVFFVNFSSIYEYPNIGDSNSITNTVQDFILVLEFVDDAGQRQRQYMDWMCDIQKMNKNDYFFVQHVWQKIFQSKMCDRFDSIPTVE